MANYSKRIMRKEFSSTDSKKAYLDTCKWYANHVVNNYEVSEKCSCSILRAYNSDTGIYTFTLELNVNVDEKEVKKKHCNICKETHNTLFKCDETNCNWCKLKAYQRRMDELIANKVQYYKECLNRHVEEV